MEDVLEDNDVTGLNISEDFHMSLFRGHLTLRHHQMDPFIDSLKSNLKFHRRFLMLLNQIQVLKNDDETRGFICLKINSYHVNESLDNLIQAVSKTLDEFRPEFSKKYNDAFIPHSSLMWFLPPDPPSLPKAIKTLEVKLQYFDVPNNTLTTFNQQEEFSEEPLIQEVTEVFATCGNKKFSIPLV